MPQNHMGFSRIGPVPKIESPVLTITIDPLTGQAQVKTNVTLSAAMMINILLSVALGLVGKILQHDSMLINTGSTFSEQPKVMNPESPVSGESFTEQERGSTVGETPDPKSGE